MTADPARRTPHVPDDNIATATVFQTSDFLPDPPAEPSVTLDPPFPASPPHSDTPIRSPYPPQTGRFTLPAVLPLGPARIGDSGLRGQIEIDDTPITHQTQIEIDDTVPLSNAPDVLLTRISNAEDQHEEEEFQPTPPPRTARRAPRRCGTRANSPASVADLFLANEPVICDVPETLALAVRDLQGRLDQSIARGKFAESDQALQAIEAARAQLLESLKKRNREEVKADIAAKLAASRQNFADFLRFRKEHEQQQEEALQARSDSLTARQMRAYGKHEENWRSEQKRRLFDRASQNLRILRVQQQYLLAARRFAEAEQVSKIADRLASEETMENHYQRCSAYQQSRARLEARHVREEESLQHAARTKRGELMFEREKGERRFSRRFYNLREEEKRAEDAQRLWNLGHRNDGDHLVALAGFRSPPGEELKPALEKRPNVEKFNTLPLPPLPKPHSPRKVLPREYLARQSL